MKWMILFSGIFSNALASVLIKVAVNSNEVASWISNPLNALCNIPLMAGIVLYGVAFLLYAITLQLLPLNVAHPILTSGAIAVVAIASSLLFGEQFTMMKLIGIITIIVGVIIITVS